MAVKLPQLEILLPSLLGVALLATVLGAYWDASWHRLNNPESFWSPPHVLLYAGVGLLGLSSFMGLILSTVSKVNVRFNSTVMTGFAVQAAAGAWDQWWHNQFGVDQPLSPPHLLLIGGFTISSLGLISYRREANRNLQTFTRIAGLVSLQIALYSVSAVLITGGEETVGRAINVSTGQKVLLEIIFDSIGIAFLLSARPLIGARFSATLLTLVYMLVEYPTIILPDPSMVAVMRHYPSMLLPAFLIDLLYTKLSQTNLRLGITPLLGGVLALYYFYFFYPLNEVYYSGWIPLEYASVFRAFLAGVLGAIFSLPLLKRFTVSAA